MFISWILVNLYLICVDMPLLLCYFLCITMGCSTHICGLSFALFQALNMHAMDDVMYDFLPGELIALSLARIAFRGGL